MGSYDAQAQGRLPAPRHLRAQRTGTVLHVTWSAVPGAWRYASTLSVANGRRELLLSRGAQASFAGVGVAFGGRVQVVPLAADGSHGSAASVSFGRDARGRPPASAERRRHLHGVLPRRPP